QRPLALRPGVEPDDRWLCRMNPANRGIETNLGPHHADSFHDDQHMDLKADTILAIPTVNVSDYVGKRLCNGARWKNGTSHVANTNFAWLLQHSPPRPVQNGSLPPLQCRRELKEVRRVSRGQQSHSDGFGFARTGGTKMRVDRKSVV